VEANSKHSCLLKPCFSKHGFFISINVAMIRQYSGLTGQINMEYLLLNLQQTRISNTSDVFSCRKFRDDTASIEPNYKKKRLNKTILLLFSTALLFILGQGRVGGNDKFDR
jgi:hypothetical protein